MTYSEQALRDVVDGLYEQQIRRDGTFEHDVRDISLAVARKVLEHPEAWAAALDEADTRKFYWVVSDVEGTPWYPSDGNGHWRTTVWFYHASCKPDAAVYTPFPKPLRTEFASLPCCCACGMEIDRG